MKKRSLVLAAAASAALTIPVLAHAVPIGPVSRIDVTVSSELRAKDTVISARDIDELTTDLKRQLTTELSKKGGMSAAGGVLSVEITKAVPTRPTFTQMSHNVSLSPRSFGLGRVELKGSYTAPGGAVTPIAYDYEPVTIEDAIYGWTWQDVEDGFGRFAYSLNRG